MYMNKNDILYFKEKLQKERVLLEEELRSVGKNDTENPAEWKATSGEIETDSADENEVADKFEELEENEMIINQLEPQLNEVIAALVRIEQDKYGVCSVCGGAIERERLEANPSAKTCVKHMHD
jgi:RNA polymerase-binding transcription factor DksA